MNVGDLKSLSMFRSMPPDALAALAPLVGVHDLEADTAVVKEGDMAQSMFILTEGSVRVERGASGEYLATIDAPNMFGEMALMVASPRLASVVTMGPCRILEIHRDTVASLQQNYPSIHAALMDSYVERLMANVVHDNSMFAPLAEEMKLDLVGAFCSQTYPPQSVLLAEGAQGPGLYLLLRGECEVLQKHDGAEELIAELKEGEIFGEISLVLFDRPCTATVRTTVESTVLFLPADAFQKIVMANAEVRASIIKLALARLQSNERRRTSVDSAAIV